MNEDILKGKWHQLKGSVKAKWGKLTNDDLDRIAGEKEKLVGRVQELYGESKEQIAKAVEQLVRAQDKAAAHDTHEGDCCNETSPAVKTEKAKSY